MGAPTEKFWDEMKEKGPPEWFSKAMEDYEARQLAITEVDGVMKNGNADEPNEAAAQIALDKATFAAA